MVEGGVMGLAGQVGGYGRAVMDGSGSLGDGCCVSAKWGWGW